MATCDKIFTIADYLRGKARNITIPDNSLLSICADVDLEPETPFADTTIKQRELGLAWLYVWIACGPTQTGSRKESDADWEHSDGGERMSANTLKKLLDMANEIFDKYDLPLVGEESWGFVGRGIRNPRRR